MTDLSREQIEWFRSKVMTYEDEYTRVLYGVCDMALRTRDAEAECERLREALMMARPFVKSWTGSRCNQAASEAVEVDKKIATALATPPPEGEPNDRVEAVPEQWRRNPPRNAQDCAYDLESVLASAPADGWKLVPVEPTQAMVLAYNTCGGTERVTADGPPRNLSTEGYRAMIAAAPTDGRE